MDYNFNYSNYSKRIHKKINFPFMLFVLIIIFLLAVAMFLKPKNKNSQCFYFVQINSYSTYQQANSLACEIQTKGGAGYIYYNKQYFVFANFYTSKTQAESVLNNIKNDYPNAKIFEFYIKIFKNNEKLSKNQCNFIKNTSNFLNSLIFDLSNLSINYDKNEIGFSEINVKFKNCFSSCSSFLGKFKKQFKTNSKYNVSKKYLLNIETDLRLLSDCKETELTQNFKYLCIDILVNYSSFLDCF